MVWKAATPAATPVTASTVTAPAVPAPQPLPLQPLPQQQVQQQPPPHRSSHTADDCLFAACGCRANSAAAR